MEHVRLLEAFSLAICAAGALLLSAKVTVAEPDYNSVGGLRDNCYLVTEKWEELSTQEQIQATACGSFINGIVNMMITNCLSDFPVPDNLKASSPHTMRAYVQGFLNWADENPNRWSDDKFLGIVDAISINFPCEE
ncbi:hypothetical protein [Yoonia sp. R78084]|uniref:hypothetical protein n=1 Tax=Yoonia sp. R78084 TaxID=3093869 RepID=UPI0037DD33DE